MNEIVWRGVRTNWLKTLRDALFGRSEVLSSYLPQDESQCIGLWAFSSQDQLIQTEQTDVVYFQTSNGEKDEIIGVGKLYKELPQKDLSSYWPNPAPFGGRWKHPVLVKIDLVNKRLYDWLRQRAEHPAFSSFLYSTPDSTRGWPPDLPKVEPSGGESIWRPHEGDSRRPELLKRATKEMVEVKWLGLTGGVLSSIAPKTPAPQTTNVLEEVRLIEPRQADESQRRRAEQYDMNIRYDVLAAFLVDGLTHRQCQREILELPAPAHGGGFEAMAILHTFGVGGDDSRGLLSEALTPEEADRIIKAKLHRFSDEQQKAIKETWELGRLGKEAERAIETGESFDFSGEDKIGQVRQRKHQQKLRQITLKSYNYMCAMCDIDDPRLLDASHIKPYARADKDGNNPVNMICLCVLHHELFDKGFVSIAADYTVLISNDLKSSSSHFLSQRAAELRQIRLPLRHRPEEKFLDYHRKKIFLDAETQKQEN